MHSECTGLLSRDPRDPHGETLHYTGPHSSAASAVSLRAIDPDRFTIINEAAGGEVCPVRLSVSLPDRGHAALSNISNRP